MAFNPQEWKDKKPTGKPKELIPEGSYPARCARIIELGDQETPYGVKTQVMFCFVIPSVTVEVDGEQKQRMISTFGINIPSAYNKDSKLGKYIDSLDASATSLESLIGKACVLSIDHQTKQDGTKYERISNISKPIAGLTLPDVDCSTYYYNFDNKEDDVFNTFPDWLKERIKSAKNW